MEEGSVSDGKHMAKILPYPAIDGSVPVPLAERESAFRHIGGRVRGSRFLDLCAGTGMIGIEAISRGASLCTFVERKARRVSMIRRNLEFLEIGHGHGEVFQAEIASFLKQMSRRRRFWDIVFCDPPFDAEYDDALRFLSCGGVLRPDGILVLRHHSEMFFPVIAGVLKRERVALYGEIAVTFYKRKA